jgi:hypothetical protein
MGRTAGLAKEQRRVLAELGRLPTLGAFYLGGGTAVAFHLGHRRSHDLDLFSRTSTVDLELVSTEVGAISTAAVVGATDAVLKVRVGTVPVDVVRYPYPLLRRPVAGPEGFPVASLLDLAAMKLAAVAKRGIRRDFWDLHEIVTRSSVSLALALRAYCSRFGLAKADLYHVLRALTHFDDAEAEPLPRGMRPAKWRAITQYFSEQAPRALRAVVRVGAAPRAQRLRGA